MAPEFPWMPARNPVHGYLVILEIRRTLGRSYKICWFLDMETPPNERASVGVPDPLKKNLDWYIANQQQLSAQYNGKILLIVDQKVIEAFNSMQEAYTVALKSYPVGTFTLQPCSPDTDSYTLMLYTPAFSHIA